MVKEQQEAQTILEQPLWRLLGFVVDLYKQDPEDKFFLVFSNKGDEYKMTINVEVHNPDGVVH